MWALVVVVTTTMSLVVNNFELKEHCDAAIVQAEPLGDEAACIWVPKSGAQVWTSTGTISLVR